MKNVLKDFSKPSYALVRLNYLFVLHFAVPIQESIRTLNWLLAQNNLSLNCETAHRQFFVSWKKSVTSCILFRAILF